MPGKGTCKAAECSKDVVGKGYCARHFAQWKRGKLAKPRHQTCNAEKCHKIRFRRGLCAEHFAKEYPGKSAPAAAAAS